MRRHRSTEVLTAGLSQQLPSFTDWIRSREKTAASTFGKAHSAPCCVMTLSEPQASQNQCLTDTVSQLLQ